MQNASAGFLTSGTFWIQAGPCKIWAEIKKAKRDVGARVKKMEFKIDQIDFKKMDGLVPAIVQDNRTNEVLMLGFVNPESFNRTLETGFVTFYSRTRQKLWMKGETSGNRLKVISTSTDCDFDSLLFKVEVLGDGLVCHEGTVSCFTKQLGNASAAASKNGEVRR